jgi:HAE1 family hydrophobic/amphiphilic exporter-1
MRGLDNNVYTQIGIVLLIALASKNAILIVEFAREERAAGKGIRDAALAAASLRFRPILMTAFSTLLGFVPLVLVVFFAPVFYIVWQGLEEWIRGSRATPPARVGVEE